MPESATIQAKNVEIAALDDIVSLLKSKVTKFESTIDDTGVYERRDTAIIRGSSIPIETAGEISSNVVTALFKEKLKLQISPRDISTPHRLGRKNNNQVLDRRKLIFKFCLGMPRDSDNRIKEASKL